MKLVSAQERLESSRHAQGAVDEIDPYQHDGNTGNLFRSSSVRWDVPEELPASAKRMKKFLDSATNPLWARSGSRSWMARGVAPSSRRRAQ
jgi:hypothetical protein